VFVWCVCSSHGEFCALQWQLGFVILVDFSFEGEEVSSISVSGSSIVGRLPGQAPWMMIGVCPSPFN